MQPFHTYTFGKGSRRLLSALIVTASFVIPSSCLASGPDEAKPAILDAAIKAQHLVQGDRKSLAEAQARFAPEGWSEYYSNHLNNFLDENGAPTFSQDFTPTGDAIASFIPAKAVEKTQFRLEVPGTLKQTHNSGSQTLYGKLEVHAAWPSAKIYHLEFSVGGQTLSTTISAQITPPANPAEAARRAQQFTAVLAKPPKAADINDAANRALVIDILGQQHAREAIPVLTKCLSETLPVLNGPDNSVAAHAANALEAITQQHFGMHAEQWRTWYQKQAH